MLKITSDTRTTHSGHIVVLCQVVLTSELGVFLCDEIRSSLGQGRGDIFSHMDVLTHELHAYDAITETRCILLNEK
jgi:hypothetical protein